MKNREKKKRKLYSGWLAVAVLAIVLVAPVLAQDEPNEPVLPEPNMPEELRLPGTVEGTGTYFEVTDSNYLNITFESSEPVHLRLESVPEMIVMDINTVDGTAPTQITLTGFPPSTIYYKYEDNYHNGVTFTTDLNGSYAFEQNLTQPHLVFIQPQPGTKFIPSDTSIGIWDPVNRIYTLTTDVYETIQIDEDNLILDGAGHTVQGGGWGIYLHVRKHVTIKNVNVQKTGISLYYSTDNNLIGNTANSSDAYGIYLQYSNNNTLTGNICKSNYYGGIYLRYSSGNTLAGNIANGIYDFGIALGQSSNNFLISNIASVNSNWGSAISLGVSNNNILTGNTATNSRYGIRLSSSNYNQIYNNNFIDNTTQAVVWSCSGNVFNLAKPIGGNYWSNWTTPDNDGDGFVDYPYIFTGGQDNLPWTIPDAWLPSEPRELYVDDDSPADPGPGDPTVSDPLEDGTQAHPFDAIQEAILFAWPGETIIVLDGTYTGAGNRDIDFKGKFITVRSQNGPENCVIDCQGTWRSRGFYFHSGETQMSTVSGLTITNAISDGGGFCCWNSSPTISNNKIIGNQAGNGGGILCRNSSPIITNNIISENEGWENGGGIYCLNSSVIIANNVIVANRAGDEVGGISFYSCSGTIVNNIIAGNLGYIGAGIGSSGSPSMVFTNNTIIGNIARYDGGAGIRCSNLSISNCIIWGNGQNQIVGNGLIVTYSDVEYGWSGEGNIDTDPQFVRPGYWEGNPWSGGTWIEGDYHLLLGSLCIDVGSNVALPCDFADLDGDGDIYEPIPFDLDGNPRIINGTVDMGAYESPIHVAIDIKPGSYPNAINLGSYGLVPVAILSSEDFDATTVNPDTVELAGAGVEVRGKSNKYMAHAEDMDGDGLVDLLLQVATQNLDPDSFQDGYAILTGETYDGVSIEGQDEITIVPPEQ